MIYRQLTNGLRPGFAIAILGIFVGWQWPIVSRMAIGQDSLNSGELNGDYRSDLSIPPEHLGNWKVHFQNQGRYFPLRARLTGFRTLQDPDTADGDKRLSGIPPSFQDGEPVVPLPAMAAPPDFQGFGTNPIDRTEIIPNPKTPAPYEWPKRVTPPRQNQLTPNIWNSDSSHTGMHEGIRSPPTVDPSNNALTMPGPVGAQNSNQLMFPWEVLDWDAQHHLEQVAHNGQPLHDVCAQSVVYSAGDFLPTAVAAQPADICHEIQTYYGKTAISNQRPWVEWWRPFYGPGMYDPAIQLGSDVNPLMPQFLVYGDYRTGVGVHRNQGQPVRSFAHRLNLDMDLKLTATERIHAFMGPLDHNGRFTRLDFSTNDIQFEEELDAQFDTGFFEGDVGSIVGGFSGHDAPFVLPFTFGLMPLVYQNGIWMEDAIAGAAFALPWKNSPLLNWSNFDATFFAGLDQVTSPAFNNNGAASVLGTAWFIEAYHGYIEADYGYLSDDDGLGRSYHNAAIAYSRRYWDRISNSIRLIGNAGQSGPRVDRTADGAMLLLENSLVSSTPLTLVPYWNFFMGYGRPQSVARSALSGGILRNTGINFESDGLTGYPTLDATGSNSYGGAIGLNMLTADYRQQLAIEFAALDTYGDPNLSTAAGAQYGIGARWQKSLNNWSLIRVDLMNAMIDNAPDIYGTRTEFRWKF